MMTRLLTSLALLLALSANAVAADTAEARRHGVTGTPFFLIDGKYALSGAQPAEAFGEALTRVWAETHPRTPLIDLGLGDPGPACGPDGCQWRIAFIQRLYGPSRCEFTEIGCAAGHYHGELQYRG